MSRPKSSLLDEAKRRLLPSFVIFCVGGIGVAVCLLAKAHAIRWLYHVGFVVAFLAALFFVLYVWWSLYVGSGQEERDPHAIDGGGSD